MAESREKKSDPAISYNAFKEYEGRRYTGMKIGRSHHWNYDPGEWTETKITPDLWRINYAVTKRRKGHAPEGSGVPLGTEYHWYILAHQNVAKQTANDYTTSLTGLKFKIAHKRAGSDKWSATPRMQRQRMIKFLKDVLADLESTRDRDGADLPKAARSVVSSRRQTGTARRPKPRSLPRVGGSGHAAHRPH
ncbi:MAG TPA: hypothetical protein VFV78_10380 [Vicinamibacterales bacterium]|nr:hypothetical protein [Vicinamibacterales bacterium]